MAEHQNSLESFQSLHTELLAFSESRLRNLDRLSILLDGHVEAFKTLLDKKARSEASRKSVESGKIDITDPNNNCITTYEINAEFQQGALQVADELDLDEVEAANIFWVGRQDAAASGRPIVTACIIRFHQYQKYLLDSLRLLLSSQLDEDVVDEVKPIFEHCLDQFLNAQNNEGKRYMTRCIESMADLRTWLQNITAEVNSSSILGTGAQKPEYLEMLEYQRISLVQQHECLGIIVELLVKNQSSHISDFELILEVLRKAERYDNLLVHQFPAFGAFVAYYGSADRGPSPEDAQRLHKKIFKAAEDAKKTEQDSEHIVQDAWMLNYVYAACRAWWLAEYSGFHADIATEQESALYSKQYAEALKDGALDFILCLSADVKSTEWTDPARHGLRMWLVRKPMSGHAIVPDTIQFSVFFQESLMEQVETYVEGFITNLPDVLRKLRIDEDEQRRSNHEHDLDLERFVLIISYAFENRPKAAFEGFWDVADGAFYGFLNWASKRASTPLVSAFCEMLQALSGDVDCANAAHKFLLDDGTQTGRTRRTLALTWYQIFKELTFFSNKIRDQPAFPPGTHRSAKTFPDPAEIEPESTLMLESYLRLISRLCTESRDARLFMLGGHATFVLTDVLFQLASSLIPSRLRACAFNTINALLTDKSRVDGEHLWSLLDHWISSGHIPGTNPGTTNTPQSVFNPTSPDTMLRQLNTGFEEPDAFVKLLQTLISPYLDEVGLFDGLPFPEDLGAAHRPPGIDPYVDFAVGHVFGARHRDDIDPSQLRLLRLACLDFIMTCLATFNEDLVVFDNISDINVDAAIKASNLQQYVVLHPLARVMEWMFNTNVMTALFATIHQDYAEVANASADSSLVLSLLAGINVVSWVLKLQGTYLDVVRPLVKSKRNRQPNPVANSAFASFEDGVLNFVEIIPDLGMFCGCGHPDVAKASLELLRLLCSSSRITATREPGIGLGTGRNRIIAAFEISGAADAVSRSLVAEMDADIDDNEGEGSHAYIIKMKILDFLNTCLQSSSSTPNIAHLLFGFDCSHDTLNLNSDPDAPFNHGTSLFHSILNLATNLPLCEESEGGINLPYWQVTLNHKCLQLLSNLWLSTSSSDIVMALMQANGAVFDLILKQIPIEGGFRWDGCDPAHPDFLLSTPADCLVSFMRQRALVFHYASAELRQLTRNHGPTLKLQILESLLGSTKTDQERVQNPSVFDLLEFMDIQFPSPQQPPLLGLDWFQGINLSVCLSDLENPASTYDMGKLNELLALRQAELRDAGHVKNPQDVKSFEAECSALIRHYKADNQLKQIWESRTQLLKSWSQLLIIMIDTNDFDATQKSAFILQILQVVMSKLENNIDRAIEVVELANLIRVAFYTVKLDSIAFESRISQLVSEKLLHAFDTCLRAIILLGANSTAKEIFYSISIRYLTMTSEQPFTKSTPTPTVRIIKSIGDRLSEIICDDALYGEPACRISALLLLSSLIKLSKRENAPFILESLTRLNFISLLVQTLSVMPSEITESLASQAGGNSLLDIHHAYIKARLALLTHIAQTRQGASAVLNAGLFHAIKTSTLFAMDPELDIDLENPRALPLHYAILTAHIRLLLTVLLSLGIQNEQTITSSRQFLTENRTCIIGVLKRAAGRVGETRSPIIEDLADAFMCFIWGVGFLEYEEEFMPRKRQAITNFT